MNTIFQYNIRTGDYFQLAWDLVYTRWKNATVSYQNSRNLLYTILNFIH